MRIHFFLQLARTTRASLVLLGCSVVVLSFLHTPTPFIGDDLPGWLRETARQPLPGYDKKVHAVVLHDEQQTQVADNGRIISSRRCAVRILVREGRSAAIAREIYLPGSGKVRDFRGWLIRPSGEIKRYGKDSIIDLALVVNDVYNEIRAKMIDASSDAETGAVFGYELVSEEESVFAQLDWDFQSRLPVLLSRFSLTLPPGWEASTVTFNHAPLKPVTNGTTSSWELRDLPFLEDEPASPAMTSLAPRLALNILAPASRTGAGKGFKSWEEVSEWLWSLSDPQSQADASLTAKVQALTAAAKNDFDRIVAIASYVQKINYVSIQTGMRRGGGYRPHAANEIFAKSYGDCKDKANLMRTMLKVVGIPAYLLNLFSGDPTYVHQEWPSPQQFNHCIIAVQVTEGIDMPSVIVHPQLGRLLIFDPTDENTPLGQLADHDQGGLGLLVARGNGALLKMPATPAETNQLKRTIEAQISPTGALSCRIMEFSTGQAAVRERRLLRQQSQSDYLRMIENWAAQGVNGARVANIHPTDSFSKDRFELELSLQVAQYAQLMQNRLLVFKPVIVSRRESLFLTEPNRKFPVMLPPESYVETVKILLPDGFVADELPEPTEIDLPFGRYKASCEIHDKQLVFSRSLVVREMTLPVEQYQQVRAFFERVSAANQAPVVLIRK